MSAKNLRVLYAGPLGPTDTSTHRRWAIERLGHEVVEFDTRPYMSSGGRILSHLRLRTLVGRAVCRLNADLLSTAIQSRPDLIWFDKATFVHATTVSKLRNLGIFTVHFNIDNPFGGRNDPGWRLILEAIPEYDLHLVQRDSNLSQYKDAGARNVRLMRTAYEPTLHFPPPPGWSDKDRLYDVVFIGAPYDARAAFILSLWQKYGIPTRIWGSPIWESVLPPDAKAALWQGGEVWNDAYRETIWRSRICLAFVTHSNNDDVAHKSFEITASGGFLLAEDTPGHRNHFRDGEEVVLFRSVEECAAKIHRYLDDETERSRIAAAGRRRSENSGYSNDARIRDVLDFVRTQLPTLRK